MFSIRLQTPAPSLGICSRCLAMFRKLCKCSGWTQDSVLRNTIQLIQWETHTYQKHLVLFRAHIEYFSDLYYCFFSMMLHVLFKKMFFFFFQVNQSPVLNHKLLMTTQLCGLHMRIFQIHTCHMSTCVSNTLHVILPCDCKIVLLERVF